MCSRRHSASHPRTSSPLKGVSPCPYERSQWDSGPPGAEDSIWTRGLNPEAVARWNAVALAAASHGMARPYNTLGINGPIASDGGVLGSDRPATALGSWACVNADQPLASAAGIIPRRPGGMVSTALAEATALALAAAAAGPSAVLIVDNLGTVNRVRGRFWLT